MREEVGIGNMEVSCELSIIKIVDVFDVIQVARQRYSGTDNEGPPHFVNFTYLCTPTPNKGVSRNESLTRIGAQMPAALAADDKQLDKVAPPGPPKIVYVGM